MSKPIAKEYLGDSVYAAADGNTLVLTIDNGCGPTATIYLDPETAEALFEYAKKMWPV